MLNSEVFFQEFERLCTLFNQPIDKLGAIYYEALQELSDDIFQRLCQRAIAHCEWMPKPVWFLAEAAELREQLAERQRQKQFCLPLGRDRYVAFSDLSPQEQQRIKQNLKKARGEGGLVGLRTIFDSVFGGSEDE